MLLAGSSAIGMVTRILITLGLRVNYFFINSNRNAHNPFEINSHCAFDTSNHLDSDDRNGTRPAGKQIQKQASEPKCCYDGRLSICLLTEKVPDFVHAVTDICPACSLTHSLFYEYSPIAPMTTRRNNNNNNIRRAASPGGLESPLPGFSSINDPMSRLGGGTFNSTMTSTMQSMTETMRATTGRVNTDSLRRSSSPSPSSSGDSVSQQVMTKRATTASFSQTTSIALEGINIEMSLSQIAEQLSVDEQTGALIATDVLIQEQPTQLRFELADYLGIFRKQFAWNYKNYHHTCKDIRLVTEDDQVFIQAIYDGAREEDEDIGPLQFDLTEFLCVFQGQLQIKLAMIPMSSTFSEVPWMKFKVVAEPDYNLFAQDPVMKMMLSHIAHSTAEFVMIQMKHKIAEAIDVSVAAVLSAAMQHVTEQMQTIVQRVGTLGKAQMSATGYENLHIGALAP